MDEEKRQAQAAEDVRRLAKELEVTEEDARGALTASGGDLLRAALALDRKRPQEERRVGVYSTAPAPVSAPAAGEEKAGEAVTVREVFRRLGQALMGAFARPTANVLAVSRRGKRLCAVPAIILAVLALAAFRITALLLILAFLTGCRMQFEGPDVADETVNAALDQVCGAIEKVWDKVFPQKRK